jgi:hypothetical protein
LERKGERETVRIYWKKVRTGTEGNGKGAEEERGF